MIVKNFQFLKRGIGIEGEKIIEKSSRSKVWKQIREWKQVEHRAQCSLYLKQNSKAFAIPILRIGIANALEFCFRYNEH